ncbi:hypothetical protein HDV01_001330 [Terramyces sp. JEL0728]|nr:hypothetical protein HDV01_001330 [Terramyces sp. JEL0728]
MEEISIAIQNELLYQNSKLKNQLKAVEQQLDNTLMEKQACQSTIQEYTLLIKKKSLETQSLSEKNQILINQEHELFGRINELEDQFGKQRKLLKQKERELQRKPETVIEYIPQPVIKEQIISKIEIQEKECTECEHLHAQIAELQEQIIDMDSMLKKTQDRYEELMHENNFSFLDQGAALGLDFRESPNSAADNTSRHGTEEATPVKQRNMERKETPVKQTHLHENAVVKALEMFDSKKSSAQKQIKQVSKSENNTPSETPKFLLRKIESESKFSSIEKIPKERRFSDGPAMWPRFERKNGKIVIAEFGERMKVKEGQAVDAENTVEHVDFPNETQTVEEPKDIAQPMLLQTNEVTAKVAVPELVPLVQKADIYSNTQGHTVDIKLQPVQSNVTLNETPIETDSEIGFGQVYLNVLGVSEQVSKMVDQLEISKDEEEYRVRSNSVESDTSEPINISPASHTAEIDQTLKPFETYSPKKMPKPEVSVFKTPERKANRSYSVRMTPDRITNDAPGKKTAATPNKYERHSIHLDDNVFLDIQRITETPKPASVISETSSITAIVYAMQGSWFQKFNRNGNNPQLRFIKFDPYTPSIQWSKQIPNQNTKLKVAYVTGIEYGNIPTNRNYPPTNEYFILIQTSDRVIKLVPISWEIHEVWVKAIKYILSSIKKHGGLREKVLLAREFCEEFSDSDDESVDKPRNRIKTVDVEMESVMSPQMRRKTSRASMTKKFEFGFTPKKKFTEYFKVSK